MIRIIDFHKRTRKLHCTIYYRHTHTYTHGLTNKNKRNDERMDIEHRKMKVGKTECQVKSFQSYVLLRAIANTILCSGKFIRCLLSPYLSRSLSPFSRWNFWLNVICISLFATRPCQTRRKTYILAKCYLARISIWLSFPLIGGNLIQPRFQFDYLISLN